MGQVAKHNRGAGDKWSHHHKLCGGSNNTAHHHKTAMQGARDDVKMRNQDEERRIRIRSLRRQY